MNWTDSSSEEVELEFADREGARSEEPEGGGNCDAEPPMKPFFKSESE